MAEYYTYERTKENLEIERLPFNDYDGSVTGTGKCVLNVKAWMDENPEERKRLGWIKHIHPDSGKIEYDRQTQYLEWSTEQVDEYTIKDVCHICDKSEEMMRLEELASCINGGGIFDSGLIFMAR